MSTDSQSPFSPFSSASEQRRWDRLSIQMSYFHEYFKQEYDSLYQLADGSFNQRGQSLNMFLNSAMQLVSHLNMHHTIEETHLFPHLGKRMKDFSKQDGGEHLKSHQGIHKGLDDLSDLVKKFKAEPASYNPEDMRKCLDSFREVLFRHLDQEVADLKGVNMQKYWTLQEVESILI